mgnify:CR=1 FL=1
MCGITGLLHVDPARSADAEVGRRMCATLVHRGPDGDAFRWIRGGEPVGLRQQRLARGSPDELVRREALQRILETTVSNITSW